MLPEIHDASEAANVREFFTNTDPTANNSYWFGLRYNVDGKTYKWDNSNTSVDYFEWNNGEPNGKPDECNVLSTTAWMWSVVNCDSKMYALCEWPTPTGGILNLEILSSLFGS